MHNPLKSLVLLGLSAAMLAACSTSSTGRQQLVLKSDAALAQEGARQFAIIRAKMPMVQDRATIDYVACVANAIVAELEGEDAAMYWELAVIDQQDINAFVLPGGKISVFKGILTVAENQHQLGAVLGHEVAHVTEKHGNERASRASVTHVGVDIASILLGGGYARPTMAANEALRTGAALGVLNPFSRKQESEADLVGLRLMAKAGFDPRQSVDLWQNMNEKNKTQIPEFLSTHPSGDTRIEQLVAALPESLAYYNEAKAQGKEPNCFL
ncbi:MAG: M48 family metallopeptidase [Woeseiaceae bacterium]